MFGPKIIKAIRGPIPYAKMMPTGGVDVDNVADWIKAGAVAVGAGSSLTAGAKQAITKELQKPAAGLSKTSAKPVLNCGKPADPPPAFIPR